jgi:hypothetical protein
MREVTEEDRNMILATSKLGKVVSELVDRRRVVRSDSLSLWKDHDFDALRALDTVRKMRLTYDVKEWLDLAFDAKIEFLGLFSMNHISLFDTFLDFLDACISELAAPFPQEQGPFVNATERARANLFQAFEPYRTLEW